MLEKNEDLQKEEIEEEEEESENVEFEAYNINNEEKNFNKKNKGTNINKKEIRNYHINKNFEKEIIEAYKLLTKLNKLIKKRKI